jgi:2-alkyl-3-oxoalkanoate reductase
MTEATESKSVLRRYVAAVETGDEQEIRDRFAEEIPLHREPASSTTRAVPRRLFITGGSGVLARALLPLAEAADHALRAPARSELDLFDPAAVAQAVRGFDAVLHLATRIRSLDQLDNPEAWRENDRLRAEASQTLVSAALAADVAVYVQPTVTFVYPQDRPVDEDTRLADVPAILCSALVAEQGTARFARPGRRGVVLRLGLLDGPGTGNDRPNPVLGATLDVRDAARALLAALTVPSGIYNVCRDGERVSNRRFSEASGWRPRH